MIAVLQVAIHEMPEIDALQQPLQVAMLLAGLVALGSLIGLISTFQAVNRYLGLSLDELY